MSDTASSARLVLESATSPPNWTISGSFRYWGAPPESEMTVAMEKAANTVAESVVANAASASAAPGAGQLGARGRRSRRSPRAQRVGHVEGELDGCGRLWSSMAEPDPMITATR